MQTMQFAVRLAAALTVIVIAAWIGRHLPKVGGLIATMPLTTLIVMLWLYSERPGDLAQMRDYTLGVLWGIGPSVLFFIVAYLCFRRQIGLAGTLCASFGAWLLGAALHVWLLHGFRTHA